jgi:hypothetical protein
MRQLLLLLLLCLSLGAIAQPAANGNWFIYFGNAPINKKWNIHHEVQYRNWNFAGDMEQLLLRTGLGYNLSENNNNLLLGYAFIQSKNYIGETDQKRTRDEHRPFQQFITRQSFGRFTVMHRYRLEQQIWSNDFNLRFRYFVFVNMALTNKTMSTPNTLYLSAYNEVFLNWDSPVFNRNRLYGAVGWVFNKNLRMEFGFMSQMQEVKSREQFQVVIFNTIPFNRD